MFTVGHRLIYTSRSRRDLLQLFFAWHKARQLPI